MIKIKIKGDLSKEIKASVEKQKQEKIKKLTEALKNATPVDTGNARDNWKFSKNSIYNEVDYIGLLNEGTSKQAPEHFIEKTLLSQDSIHPSGTILRSV